jgi:hypothetical protein
MSDLTEQVVVRLSTETLRALQASARENERNVTQEIRMAIRKHLAAVGGPTETNPRPGSSPDDS